MVSFTIACMVALVLWATGLKAYHLRKARKVRLARKARADKARATRAASKAARMARTIAAEKAARIKPYLAPSRGRYVWAEAKGDDPTWQRVTH